MSVAKFKRHHFISYFLFLAAVAFLSHLYYTPERVNDTPTAERTEPEPEPAITLRGKKPDFFTQQFAAHGLGHKSCELMMGLRFATINNLEYVFDENSFLSTLRGDDLRWMSNLLKRRFQTLESYLASTPEPPQEIQVKDYLTTTTKTIDAHIARNTGWLDEPVEVDRIPSTKFWSDPGCGCNSKDANEGTCWEMGQSFFNKSRQFQNILALEAKEQGTELGALKLVPRVAIHLRIGDVHSMLKPKEYVELIRGIEIKHDVIFKPEQIHFLFYAAAYGNPSTAWDNEAIGAVQKVIPNAQYHNMESTEETVRFLANSEFLVTSGSSFSYLAAYLCPTCNVIFTEPKEYPSYRMRLTEKTYNKNFYYMDEWVPYYRYMNLPATPGDTK